MMTADELHALARETRDACLRRQRATGTQRMYAAREREARERIEELCAEVAYLRAAAPPPGRFAQRVLDEVREALGAPDGVDIREHAAAVVRARDEARAEHAARWTDLRDVMRDRDEWRKMARGAAEAEKAHRAESEELRLSLAERTAEREAMCERVSVLEEENARWRAATTTLAIREAEERGARWALSAAAAAIDEHDGCHDAAASVGTIDPAWVCETARKAGEHE